MGTVEGINRYKENIKEGERRGEKGSYMILLSKYIIFLAKKRKA